MCVCPFHRDDADPVKTRCTRTLSYLAASRELTVRTLKAWCLDGTLCKYRAHFHDRSQCHKWPKQAVVESLPSDADLNNQLRAAMQQPQWIAVAEPSVPEHDTEMEFDGTRVS